jgi:hypothetical protein
MTEAERPCLVDGEVGDLLGRRGRRRGRGGLGGRGSFRGLGANDRGLAGGLARGLRGDAGGDGRAAGDGEGGHDVRGFVEAGRSVLAAHGVGTSAGS